jgi:membrane protein
MLERGPDAMQQLRRRLEELIKAAIHILVAIDRRLVGIPGLLKDTFDSYNAHDGLFLSAAMAYFFFFTLFPLALALVAISSLFFQTDLARQQVTDLFARVVPISRELIVGIINQVVAQAGAIGILATLGFVYSGSGLFGVLLAVVNRVWQCPAARPSYIQRLLAIGLVFAFAVVVFLISFVTTALEAASRTRLRGLPAEVAAGLFTGVSLLASLAITAALFTILFWKLPATRVYFADAWPAAVLTALAWEAARQLYAWYLARFANFTLVYGSLAAIIGLLAWFNLTGFIILMGAELSAQIANRRGRGPAQCQR